MKNHHMKNPHIIVGPNRRCLCGVYDGKSITCSELITNMSALSIFRGDNAAVNIIRVLKTLIEDCE